MTLLKFDLIPFNQWIIGPLGPLRRIDRFSTFMRALALLRVLAILQGPPYVLGQAIMPCTLYSVVIFSCC